MDDDGSLPDAHWDEVEALYAAYDEYRRATPYPLTAYEWLAQRENGRNGYV